MSDEAPTPTEESVRKEAWWPLILLGAYLITLAVGVVGELFEIPAVLRLFLYR